MNYQETIEYLFNSTPVFEHVGAAAYKEGLYNTEALDEYFHHPHRHYKTIHIAGTNGKGSTSHMLAATLQKAGYRVGLYTSPHLVDFSERIRINGKPIDQQYVVDFVEQHRHFFEPLHPSFFELTTAMAFRYFADQQVDWAIIEVGLGGRLDCTNIIRPELCVITNISYDHTQFLGHTLAAIAVEKAGIIKKGVPVVIGEAVADTRLVFERKASDMQAPITFAQDFPDVSEAKAGTIGLAITSKSLGEAETVLSGTYQQANINTVMAAVHVLLHKKVIADYECVKHALLHVYEDTGLKGRWQTLEKQPLTICDTGHNVGGWNYLSKQIAQTPCLGRRRIIFGMVDDKDIDRVLDLLPQEAVYYFTQASTHRAIPSERVAEKAKEHGLKGSVFHGVADAYRQAQQEAHPDDFIFVGGSSYVVADLLTSLEHKE